MIPPIDRLIERFLKSILHARRDSFINKKMGCVETEYPLLTEEQKAEIRTKLEEEIVRIYPIVDASILRANIIKARYYFWFIATVATLYVGSTREFSSKEALNLFAPLATSVPVWLASWGTIPIFYNLRIEGAMDSAVAKYMHDTARAGRGNAPAPALDTSIPIPEEERGVPLTRFSVFPAATDEAREGEALLELGRGATFS